MENKLLKILTVCEEQSLKLLEKVLKLKYWTKNGDYSVSATDYSKLFEQTQELIAVCRDIERSLNWVDLKGKNNE